jgi:uncharacterized protein YlzI (FlbEa/FlbD family)
MKMKEVCFEDPFGDLVSVNPKEVRSIEQAPKDGLCVLTMGSGDKVSVKGSMVDVIFKIGQAECGRQH